MSPAHLQGSNKIAHHSVLGGRTAKGGKRGHQMGRPPRVVPGPRATSRHEHASHNDDAAIVRTPILASLSPQGVPGAYSEQASLAAYEGCVPQPFDQFENAFEA